MKVRNVISLAAANLGREDLVALTEDCAEQPAGELASLLRCYNLVENEIALDYFPLRQEEDVEVQGGILPYTELQFAPVEILEVREEGGSPLSFRCGPVQLTLPETVKRVHICYRYSPKEKQIDDDVEAFAAVSARLIAFGVCCEFCLTYGQFSEAATWEHKYREAIRAAGSRYKKLTVRSRRWA